MRLDFKHERDRDFMQAYQNILSRYGKNAPFIKKETLIRETIFHPAKRFYVSPEQSLRILSQLLRNQKVDFKNPVKKEMYTTLLHLIKSKLPTDRPLINIVTETIYTPAPRFYLTLESASILYYKLIKQPTI